MNKELKESLINLFKNPNYYFSFTNMEEADEIMQLLDYLGITWGSKTKATHFENRHLLQMIITGDRVGFGFVEYDDKGFIMRSDISLSISAVHIDYKKLKELIKELKEKYKNN